MGWTAVLRIQLTLASTMRRWDKVAVIADNSFFGLPLALSTKLNSAEVARFRWEGNFGRNKPVCDERSISFVIQKVARSTSGRTRCFSNTHSMSFEYEVKVLDQWKLLSIDDVSRRKASYKPSKVSFHVRGCPSLFTDAVFFVTLPSFTET